MAASSLGDLHAAVPAEPFVVAAPAAVVVSCACMDMHSLYRLSFELVLVWTCMDLYRLHLGLYALRYLLYLHLDFYGLNVMQIVIYEMIVTFNAIYMNCL